MVSRRAFFKSTLGFLAAAVAAPFLPKPKPFTTIQGLALHPDAFKIASQGLPECRLVDSYVFAGEDIAAEAFRARYIHPAMKALVDRDEARQARIIAEAIAGIR